MVGNAPDKVLAFERLHRFELRRKDGETIELSHGHALGVDFRLYSANFQCAHKAFFEPVDKGGRLFYCGHRRSSISGIIPRSVIAAARRR